MSVCLLRVDDRLIHGQVVVGWGQTLHPNRLVLADDHVAANRWEADLYRAGVPNDVDVDFVTVNEAAGRFEDWVLSEERTIVLVKGVDELLQLCAGTGSVKEVNLGGIHQSGERAQRLSYLFLTDEELARLNELEGKGVKISAQDLPNAAPIALRDIAE